MYSVFFLQLSFGFSEFSWNLFWCWTLTNMIVKAFSRSGDYVGLVFGSFFASTFLYLFAKFIVRLYHLEFYSNTPIFLHTINNTPDKITFLVFYRHVLLFCIWWFIICFFFFENVSDILRFAFILLRNVVYLVME